MSRLNIVNGMAMLSYIKEFKIDLGGDVVPFNECMCEGFVTADIFGAEFELARCTTHGVGIEEYEDIVINYLHPLFSEDYDELHLFFDEDMFCQINLITLLAYLDMTEYEGKIALHIIDNSFAELNVVELKSQSFFVVYKQLLIEKKVPEIVLPELMSDAVIKYLDYSSDNSEIVQYILENIDVDENTLLDMLFSRFGSYGLGDTQLQKQIDLVKNRNW